MFRVLFFEEMIWTFSDFLGLMCLIDFVLNKKMLIVQTTEGLNHLFRPQPLSCHSRRQNNRDWAIIAWEADYITERNTTMCRRTKHHHVNQRLSKGFAIGFLNLTGRITRVSKGKAKLRPVSWIKLAEPHHIFRQGSRVTLCFLDRGAELHYVS